MEIAKNVPELDMVARGVLSAGFQSMNAATLTLDTVEGKTPSSQASLVGSDHLKHSNI